MSTLYPRPELLVEPDWLAARLDDPRLRIIDCDPAELSAARPHIRGAVPLGIHHYFRDLATFSVVAPAVDTEIVLRRLGVDNDTRVILYGSNGGYHAARTWWVMWYHGHENVAILNGGWPAWEAAGLPSANAWAQVPPGSFTANTRPERLATCDLMLPHVGAPDFVALDVRDDLEWSGAKPAPNERNQREGRIPGAVHIEWKEFVDWDKLGRFKPASEIEAMLVGSGITRDKRVVPY